MSDRPEPPASRAARLAGEIEDGLVGKTTDERDTGWAWTEAATTAERDAGVPARRDPDEVTPVDGSDGGS